MQKIKIMKYILIVWFLIFSITSFCQEEELDDIYKEEEFQDKYLQKISNLSEYDGDIEIDIEDGDFVVRDISSKFFVSSMKVEPRKYLKGSVSNFFVIQDNITSTVIIHNYLCEVVNTINLSSEIIKGTDARYENVIEVYGATDWNDAENLPGKINICIVVFNNKTRTTRTYDMLGNIIPTIQKF